MEIFDWLVLAAYALLMLGVGAFYSRQNKTADDYLLGGPCWKRIFCRAGRDSHLQTLRRCHVSNGSRGWYLPSPSR